MGYYSAKNLKEIVVSIVVWVIGFALGTVHLGKYVLSILEAMERFGLAKMATVTRVWDMEFGE